MKQTERPRGRVVLLTQFFYPEKAAVAQFMTELARQLHIRGLEITVLTSNATYHRDGRLPARETIDGVDVRRLWGTRFDKRNLAGRICNLVTFITAAIVHMLFTKSRPALLFISNAPLLGIVGRVARLLRGQKYICLIQDVYPDLAVTLGLFGDRSVARRVWDGVNRRVYSSAESVIVLGNRMRDVVSRNLRSSDRMHVIPDWADGDAIRPLPKDENWFAREYDLLDRIVVLYSGNHGLAHDLETLIEAADRLREDVRFLFLFIGEGGKKAKLLEMVEERELGNVRFLPYQPIENLPFTLTCGDISVVTMEEGVEGLVIPSKIYGALAAGQAILALVGERTEVGDIVSENACGCRVRPKDIDGMVGALLQLAADDKTLAGMKQGARAGYENNYRKDIAMERYYTLIANNLGLG